MATLQVWIDDETAERVRRAAERDRRSVSEWLRLLIEDGLADRPSMDRPMPAVKPDRSKVKRIVDAPVPDCSHEKVRKVPGESGGTVKVCVGCGLRILR